MRSRSSAGRVILRAQFVFGVFGVFGMCGALTLAGAAGCSGRSTKPTPVSSDGAGGGDSSGGSDSTSAQESPMKEIQKLVAQEFNVSADDVKVSLLDQPKTPGITAFTSIIDPKKLGREGIRNGVFDGKQLLGEGAAISAVARAWGYGATRTASAVDVARTFSALHSARAGVSAILDARMLQVFKSTQQPNWAGAAFLPTEETVDGLPAVKYCIRSGSRAAPPFAVVTAVFKDGGVDLRVQEIPKD